MQTEELHFFPSGFGDWLHSIGGWLVTNVVWGGVALVLGFVVNVVRGAPWALPDDFTLGITVLAVAIAGSSVAVPDGYIEPWAKRTYWCKTIATLILLGGAGIGSLASIKGIHIDQSRVLDASLGLLVLSVVIGFVSYVSQIKGRDLFVDSIIQRTAAIRTETGDFAGEEKLKQASLKSAADVLNNVGDLNL